MVMSGPDQDFDRAPGYKRHWDWDAAWSKRFGLVQLQVRRRFRVTVERPEEVSPVRHVYGILFREDGKAVLVGRAAGGGAPELRLIAVDVPEGQHPQDALQDAALSRAGAELGRVWLMANLLYTPIEGNTEPAHYESICLAEVTDLRDEVPDPTYTRRSVLRRDLLEAVRTRHYDIAEPLLIAIDRYVHWRAMGEGATEGSTAEVTGG